MVEDIRSGLRDHWLSYCAALGAVGAVSLLIGAITSYRPVGNLPMLYLLAVLMAAIRFGRGPAIAASIASFLTFDWFFVVPYHRFTIADPAGMGRAAALLTGRDHHRATRGARAYPRARKPSGAGTRRNCSGGSGRGWARLISTSTAG